MTARSECRICLQNRALTHEDIFPTWMRALSRELAPSGAVLPPRVKVRICRLCNESLGQNFQEPAARVIRPLLRDRAANLSVEDQRVIAGWVAQSALIQTVGNDQIRARYNGQEHKLEIIRTAIVDMMATGAPPPSCSVRIQGCALRGDTLRRPGAHPLGVMPSALRTLPTVMAAVTVFGPLAAEFVFFSPGAAVGAFVEETSNDPWLIRIWPVTGTTVTFPTATLLLPDMLFLDRAVGLPSRNRRGRMTTWVGRRDPEIAQWQVGDTTHTWLATGRETDQ